MNTYVKSYFNAFAVSVKDLRTGEIKEDKIVFSREQLRVAGLCGQSSKELIHRAYNREGYLVLDVGKAHKFEVTFDLMSLYQEETGE